MTQAEELNKLYTEYIKERNQLINQHNYKLEQLMTRYFQEKDEIKEKHLINRTISKIK